MQVCGQSPCCGWLVLMMPQQMHADLAYADSLQMSCWGCSLASKAMLTACSRPWQLGRCMTGGCQRPSLPRRLCTHFRCVAASEHRTGTTSCLHFCYAGRHCNCASGCTSCKLAATPRCTAAVCRSYDQCTIERHLQLAAE